MAAVLIEAALVGLLASLLGIAGGFGFVELIEGLFKAMGFELPTSGLALEVDRRDRDRGRRIDDDGRGTQPGAAGDQGRATGGPGRERGQHRAAHERSRRRTIIASILVAAGVALLPLGLFATDDIEIAPQLPGLGLVLLFIGWPWSATGSWARSRACSAGRSSACAASPAGSRARMRSGSPAAPRPPPRH